MKDEELQRSLSLGPSGTPPMGLKLDHKALQEFLSKSMSDRFDRIEQHLSDHEKRLLQYITMNQSSVNRLDEVERTGKHRILELERNMSELVSSINDQLTYIRKHMVVNQGESLRVNTSIHEVRMELLDLAQSQTKATIRTASLQWGGVVVVVNAIFTYAMEFLRG
jgi:CII-binding regulator of phage lambda lysogenization HflD